MGQKDKLIKKLKSKPRDFTFEEAEVLLNYLNFRKSNKGKTSGSRVIFTSNDHGSILLHKPHPRKELLDYQGDILPPLSLTLRSGGFLFDSPIGLSISRLSPRAPRFFLSP